MLGRMVALLAGVSAFQQRVMPWDPRLGSLCSRSDRWSDADEWADAISAFDEEDDEFVESGLPFPRTKRENNKILMASVDKVRSFCVFVIEF